MSQSTEEQQYQQYYHQYHQPPAAYDPSQTYHPSSSTTTQTQSYYPPYANQHYDPQQQYAYYSHHDYANPYPQYHYHQDPASIQPPGVDATQDKAYYQQPPVDNHYHYSDPGSSGSNPVAPVSQPVPYRGNISSVQLDVNHQIEQPPYMYGGRMGEQPPYMGGGRMGGRPMRGGGRGNRGRGGSASSRGKGRGRNFPPQGRAPTEGSSAPPKPPRVAKCELCKVDCNTQEILEQHLNGKKHKKNLQTHERSNSIKKPITAQQNTQTPHLPISEVSVQTSQPIIAANLLNDNPEVPNSIGDPKMNVRNHFEGRGRGLKRKMRGSRGGGKAIRTNDGSRTVEPHKPKEVIPYVCELCGVKCDTHLVFNTHLGGKKHQINFKRFQDHRALYGEDGFHPPNFGPASSSSFIPQPQQNINDPQVLLATLLNIVIAQAQAPGLVNPMVQGPVVPLAPALASAPHQVMHQNPDLPLVFGSGGKVNSEVEAVKPEQKVEESKEVISGAEAVKPEKTEEESKQVISGKEAVKLEKTEEESKIVISGTEAAMIKIAPNSEATSSDQ